MCTGVTVIFLEYVFQRGSQLKNRSSLGVNCEAVKFLKGKDNLFKSSSWDWTFACQKITTDYRMASIELVKVHKKMERPLPRLFSSIKNLLKMNSHLSISVVIEILLTSALVECQFSVSKLNIQNYQMLSMLNLE